MERRVLLEARRSVRDVDLEAPRQRRRPAEELLVEVVAPPPDRLREHDAGRDRVHEHERVEVAAARERRRPRSAPPATAPQIDSPPFQISNGADDAALAPLVPGEEVVHARADDARDHDRDDDRAELLRRRGPCAVQRVSATLAATSTPIASISPYACSGSGPMCTMPCCGLGMNATGTAAMLGGRFKSKTAGRPMQCAMSADDACSPWSWPPGAGRVRALPPCPVVPAVPAAGGSAAAPVATPGRASAAVRCSPRTTRGTRRSTSLAVRSDSTHADREHHARRARRTCTPTSAAAARTASRS